MTQTEMYDSVKLCHQMKLASMSDCVQLDDQTMQAESIQLYDLTMKANLPDSTVVWSDDVGWPDNTV